MNIDEQVAWMVREQNVTRYTLGQREHTASVLVNRINEYHASVSVEALRKQGIVSVPPMNKGMVSEIQKFLELEPVYNAHRVCYSDGVARKLTSDYGHAFGSHALDAVIRCPHLLRWALHPDHLALAREYLGCIPTLYSVHAWWSVAGHPAPMTQTVHRDYDDFKFVSLITYLTDVGPDNGPHVFWPGTHKKESNAGVNPVVLTGAAGTSFMADTYAYHQGMPLKSGRRLAFWARYGLYKNWIYDNDRAGRVPLSLINGRIEWTEELRYITRLLFEEQNQP